MGKAWQLCSEMEHMLQVWHHWWPLSLWGSQPKWRDRPMTVQGDRDGYFGANKEAWRKTPPWTVELNPERLTQVHSQTTPFW